MLNWETVRSEYERLKPIIEEAIRLSLNDIRRYPINNNNGETLSQLLANLNWSVQKLGELQPQIARLKGWTEGRYSIEKGLETVRIVKSGKPVGYAGNAKYEKVQEFLDITVETDALHMRVQNARSSARDTTEAIRSRIGQLRGQIRSS